jgi:hypothetical protein
MLPLSIVAPEGSAVLDAFEPFFFIGKCISLLRIIYMSILRCVFFYRESGRCCRSRTAFVSGPDRKIFPVKTGGFEWRFLA